MTPSPSSVARVFPQNEYRFLILGVGGAGKTCVLESLKTRFSPMPGLPPEQIVPTVGLNLARLEIPATRGGAETCVFWDLGGAPSLRGIWERYYAECDGVLFVVDAARAEDAEGDERERAGGAERADRSAEDTGGDEQTALLRSVLAEPRLADAPALVFVNKADTVSAVSAARTARTCASALEEAGTRRYRVDQTVGTDGRGTERGVDWLVGETMSGERVKRRLAAAARER